MERKLKHLMQDLKLSPVVWKIFTRILEEPADLHLRDTEADCEDGGIGFVCSISIFLLNRSASHLRRWWLLKQSVVAQTACVTRISPPPCVFTSLISLSNTSTYSIPHNLPTCTSVYICTLNLIEIVLHEVMNDSRHIKLSQLLSHYTRLHCHMT
jgi:hypothetical protein